MGALEWRLGRSEMVARKRFSFYLCLQSIYLPMQQDEVNLGSDRHSDPADHSEMMPDSAERAQGRWQEDQHLRFLTGLFKFGKNWKEIQTLVGTRACSQVRSHAQKYFIKLQKIIKDRKKQKNKQNLELTDIQKEVLQRFTMENVTEKTPEVLVNLLQNQCLVPPKSNQKNCNVAGQEQKQNERKGFSKVVKEKSASEQKETEKQTKKEAKIKSSGKKISRNENLIDSYCDQEQDESKSFFYRLMQNNVEHFRQGKDFSFLIDFVGVGRHHEDIQNKPEDLDSSETTRNRRSSFTLVQDQQNDQRLTKVLEKIKNGESCQKTQK